MNIQLKDITFTARDGRVSHLDQVYIRGSQVRYFIVPDMLKHAPMFKNIATGAKGKGIGLGRGKATVYFHYPFIHYINIGCKSPIGKRKTYWKRLNIIMILCLMLPFSIRNKICTRNCFNFMLKFIG